MAELPHAKLGARPGAFRSQARRNAWPALLVGTRGVGAARLARCASRAALPPLQVWRSAQCVLQGRPQTPQGRLVCIAARVAMPTTRDNSNAVCASEAIFNPGMVQRAALRALPASMGCYSSAGSSAISALQAISVPSRGAHTAHRARRALQPGRQEQCFALVVRVANIPVPSDSYAVSNAPQVSRQ